MADKIFFIQGDPEDFLQYSIPTEMVDDLRQIAALPIDKLKSFADTLEAEPGFVGDKRLDELIHEHLGVKEDLLLPIGRTLSSIKLGGVSETIERLARWRKAKPENQEKVSEDDIIKLGENLKVLIRKYPALARQRKAQRLRRATGYLAETVEFICDFRPIFDESHENIEGLLPVVTATIGYQTQNEEQQSIELMFTEDSLKELLKEAEKAKKKVEVLKQTAKSWITNGMPGSD